jgi:hypothetical protein
MFEEGNNCKTVYNRIRDKVVPYPATVTIGLYGYKGNNSIRGYVASGESASEVSLWNQSESVSRRSQRRSVPEESPRSEKSVISKSCNSWLSEITQCVFSFELVGQ